MVVVVFVEHGGHGGADAAPLAKLLYESRFRQRAQRAPQPREPRDAREDQGRRSPDSGTAMIRERLLPTLDLNFVGTALVISSIGCLLVYSATYFTDPALSLFRKQILWVAIGLVLMAIFTIIDYHVFFDIAPILYGI